MGPSSFASVLRHVHPLARPSSGGSILTLGLIVFGHATAHSSGQVRPQMQTSSSAFFLSILLGRRRMTRPSSSAMRKAGGRGDSNHRWQTELSRRAQGQATHRPVLELACDGQPYAVPPPVLVRMYDWPVLALVHGRLAMRRSRTCFILMYSRYVTGRPTA